MTMIWFLFLILLIPPLFMQQRALIIYAGFFGSLFALVWVHDLNACSQPGNCGGFSDAFGRVILTFWTLGLMLGVALRGLMLWLRAEKADSNDE